MHSYGKRIRTGNEPIWEMNTALHGNERFIFNRFCCQIINVKSIIDTNTWMYYARVLRICWCYLEPPRIIVGDKNYWISVFLTHFLGNFTPQFVLLLLFLGHLTFFVVLSPHFVLSVLPFRDHVIPLLIYLHLSVFVVHFTFDVFSPCVIIFVVLDIHKCSWSAVAP